MTNRELIDLLRQFSPDARVLLQPLQKDTPRPLTVATLRDGAIHLQSIRMESREKGGRK